MHTSAVQQSPTSPDVEVRADHSHDEDHVQVCALLYTHSACTHTVRHMTEPATARGHLTAFFITCTSTSRVKNTPLPSLTLRVLPSPPVQQKLGSRPTRRHLRHLIFRFPTTATPATQYAQEQDTDAPVYGTYPCTVPSAWGAQVRLRACEATTSPAQSPVVRQGESMCRRQFWLE